MILQKCMTFWDYKREREKMKITKEDVLKIEHEMKIFDEPTLDEDEIDYYCKKLSEWKKRIRERPVGAITKL